MEKHNVLRSIHSVKKERIEIQNSDKLGLDGEPKTQQIKSEDSSQPKQKDIQKLIDEVTKKEEKWTKE